MEKQMTQTARDIFVVGLRNAHAMEVQARELMERQSERLADYPEVKAKLTEHLRETNQQLKRLEQCLEACGERPPPVSRIPLNPSQPTSRQWRIPWRAMRY